MADADFVTRREYEEHNKRMEDEHSRMNARLKIVEDGKEQDHKLLVSVEKLAMGLTAMQKEQEKQGKRLEELEKRDGQKWQSAVDTIVKALIGAGVGFVLAQIGF